MFRLLIPRDRAFLAVPSLTRGLRLGVFITFGGPAGPWSLPCGRGSVQAAKVQAATVQAATVQAARFQAATVQAVKVQAATVQAARFKQRRFKPRRLCRDFYAALHEVLLSILDLESQRRLARGCDHRSTARNFSRRAACCAGPPRV